MRTLNGGMLGTDRILNVHKSASLPSWLIYCQAAYLPPSGLASLEKTPFLSLCELIMGSKDGLQPIEKTVIDRCVHQIYQRYFDNPVPENMPVLEDLYNALLKQDEKEAHHVATALEIYVKGSLKLFNNRTNVDINNRLVCYDIKELGNQLKKIGSGGNLR